MTCPFCGRPDHKVVDSRESREGNAIRRRRHCVSCNRRFTTYERTDEIPYMVIKKDGRREKFDRQNVLNGLLRAAEKRSISMGDLQHIVNVAETMVMESPDRECPTAKIGELLMEKLQAIDKVAYVRFASVYRDFQDEGEFLKELESLIRQKKKS